MDSDQKIISMKIVVNKFNNYFANVGSNLAKKIPVSKISTNLNDIESNTCSMYLNPVQEKEIIDIVNKCKNKTSSDDPLMMMRWF